MKIKRACCLSIVVVFVLNLLLMQNIAYADYFKDGYPLDIDTSEVHVADAYDQIRNAAAIHVVVQKMHRCISIGAVPVDDYWNKGHVLNDGYFFDNLITIDKGSSPVNVALGPYLEQFNEVERGTLVEKLVSGAVDITRGDGQARCYRTNLLDSLAYLYKNYRTSGGLTAFSKDSLENPSVTSADRLKIICDIDNPTQPGLMRPADVGLLGGYKGVSAKACNDSTVSGYTGNYSYSGDNAAERRKEANSTQLFHLGKIYDEIKRNSGNKYLPEFTELENYNKVDGYYLYSRDFQVQCSAAYKSFSATPGSDGNYVKGFKVDDSGAVQQGYYKIDAVSDDAKMSFIGIKLTCVELVSNMNRTIVDYLKVVNNQIFSTCKRAIDEEIDNRINEVQEKYLSAGKRVDDANALIAEYDRIRKDGEYVVRRDSDGEDELVPISYNTGAGSDGRTYEISNSPTDYILQCRSSLPYIEVVVEHEDSVFDALEAEFYDACRNTVRLAWLVCPVVNSITGAVDGLQAEVEEFFK